MLTGPPPKFHGTRDILSRDSASGGHPEDSERLAEIETELSIADEYGTFNSLADVLSQIGHDERVHA